jgi:hypothetical protein
VITPATLTVTLAAASMEIAADSTMDEVVAEEEVNFLMS